MAHSIRIFEHDWLPVGEQGFTDVHFKALNRFNDKNGGKYFQAGYGGLRFRQYVGVIQVGRLTIEVLPKADRDSHPDQATWHRNLIEMLRFCRLLKVDALDHADLQLRRMNLLDLYIHAFLTEVRDLLRGGLVKAYHPQQGNLNTMKGRLDFPRHLRRNLIHRERFAVVHQAYDLETLPNQLLRMALDLLPSLVSAPGLLDRIQALRLEFPELPPVRVDAGVFDRITLNRKSFRYAVALQIARMILLHHAPEIKGGCDHVLAILFDMNRLFEEYIFRQLQRHAPPGIQVSRPGAERFWTSPDRSYRNLKPDILVESATERVVLDTKWKAVSPGEASMADLRQMYAYAHHFRAQRSWLVYPHTGAQRDSRGTFTLPHEEKRLHCGMHFVRLTDGAGRLDGAGVAAGVWAVVGA